MNQEILVIVGSKEAYSGMALRRFVYLDDEDNVVPPEKATRAVESLVDDATGKLLEETWYDREKKS